jgi:hypothetical protein
MGRGDNYSENNTFQECSKAHSVRPRGVKRSQGESRGVKGSQGESRGVNSAQLCSTLLNSAQLCSTLLNKEEMNRTILMEGYIMKDEGRKQFKIDKWGPGIPGHPKVVLKCHNSSCDCGLGLGGMFLILGCDKHA